MASLAIALRNKTTPIDPTIPGSAITFAGYPNESFDIHLVAYNDQGESVIPVPTDIVWDVQNTTVAKLSTANGLDNTITMGPSRGETTATVRWVSKNIRGIIKLVTVSVTTQTTVTYDDGTIKGQLIRLVTEPMSPLPGDPAGATKIYVTTEGVVPNIAQINSTTDQSKLSPRGSILKMSEAMTVTGDGLLPIKINSNVGDPIDVRRTLVFRNRTLNVPIQVTVKVADYFGIYSEYGELKNFNFIVHPQEVQRVEYGINKDTIKTLVPNTYANPIKISMVSMDSGQIFLE